MDIAPTISVTRWMIAGIVAVLAVAFIAVYRRLSHRRLQREMAKAELIAMINEALGEEEKQGSIDGTKVWGQRPSWLPTALAVVVVLAVVVWAGAPLLSELSEGTAELSSANAISTEPTGQQNTGAVEKPTITFYDGSWGSLWISNAIAMFIIEEGYGYPCEESTMSTDIMKVALSKGEVLINMEQWYQNYPEWYDENIGAGNFEELGFSLEGGPQFWCIPQWVHEEYGITTIFDMKDHWELFKDSENPSKGAFINCKIGWQCEKINTVKMKAYGLDEYYNVISPGTTGAEAAAMAGPQKKHEPVFGYYWAPTDLMGMFDWYVLEEPEYDADVWDKIIAKKNDPEFPALTEACAYESVPLTITTHKSVREKAPEVVTMLEKFTVGLDRCNKALAWQTENETVDWEAVAVWFLREYDSVWKTWVTADAYRRIQEALERDGGIVTYNLVTSTSPSHGGSVRPGSGAFEAGESVTLTATPSSGYEFKYWSGDASGTNPTLAVSMTSDRSVAANFSNIRRKLTTSVSPPGGGSISPSNGTYDSGDRVTLTATPSSGYQFDHWSGHVTGTSSTITLTMDSSKSVIANFSAVYTGPPESSTVTTTTSGMLIAKTTVGVDVTVALATGALWTPAANSMIAVAGYPTNPQSDTPLAALKGGFYDVYFVDTNTVVANQATSVLVKFYNDNITVNTVVYVWSELVGAWMECTMVNALGAPAINQGVNLFGGFAWVTITDATIPAISDLSGTPFALVELAKEAAIAPAAPTILTPAFGEEEAPIQPTFTWTAVPTATSYEFVLAEEIGLDDKFAIIDYSATTDINGHVAREQLKYDTVYHWRVRAVNDVGAGPWTTGFFTTIAE